MRISMPARWARRRPPSAGDPDPFELPTAVEQHNGRLMLLESPFAGLALVGAPSFFAFFAIQMGASNSTVGWLTAGPALVSLLWLIPCSQLIQRQESLKSPILMGLLFHRLLLIALAFVPILPAGLRTGSLVFVAAAMSVPQQYWALAYDTLAGNVLSPRHFARIVGRRWAGIDLSGVVAVLLLGKMIDTVAFPINWMVLTAGLGLVTLASLVVFSGLQQTERTRPLELSGADERPRLALKTMWRDHRAFILLEVGVLLVYFAYFAAAPILRIFWIRDLGANGAWVGGLAAAFSGGAVLGSLLWGPMSHPRRDRALCLLGGLGAIVAYPLLTAAAGSLPAAAIVVAVSGFFIVANDLMIYKRVMAVSPREQRPTLLAIHNIVYNGVAFVAPLLSTLVTDGVGTRLTLILTGVVGAAGIFFLYVYGWRPTTDAQLA